MLPETASAETGRSPARPERLASANASPVEAGDRFEEDILEALPRMRRIASALAGSAADGEDLLQDTIERALERKSQWRGGNLGGWLYAIMSHLNANNQRHVKCLPMVELDGLDDVVGADNEVENLDRLRLTQAIQALEPQYRNVVLLHVIEGYGYKDIALKLEIPVGTVMSRLSRARRLLAVSFENTQHDAR